MKAVFLFCRDADSGADGRLNIHGVFNELYAPDFPARQDRMVLAGVIEWQRNVDGRIPFTVELNDPDGMAVFSIEGHTDVDARPRSRAPARTHLILPLENVMFPAPGEYEVHVDVNGTALTGPSMHLMRAE